MKKKVILSYDYELFFGEQSGTVQKTLIGPTNKLLDVMDECGLIGSFFVDWQMLKYLKEVNDERTCADYAQIEKQLKDIIRRGHRIELHIHPHWVDAKYNGDGTWDFSDFHHYSLNSFSEKEITNMFNEGVDLLTSIARTVDPAYTICAFRAGGWAVQPFGILRNAFKMAEIKLDSSVALGKHYNSKYSYFDFRTEFGYNSEPYLFYDDVLKSCENGDIIEAPISTYKHGMLHMSFNKLYDIFVGKRKCITDGTHKRCDLPPAGRDRLALMSLSKRSPLSVLYGFLCSPLRVVTIIDHPKDFSLSVTSSIKYISKFAEPLTYLDIVKNYEYE